MRILWLAGMLARLLQIVNATLLGLAAAKVCFGSQRNFGTKNLKIVSILKIGEKQNQSTTYKNLFKEIYFAITASSVLQKRNNK